MGLDLTTSSPAPHPAYHLSGGILQGINHGLSTPLLFLVVGIVYEQRHTLAIAEYGGTLFVTEPKTTAGRRRVALDLGTGTALREHRRRQLAERVVDGAGQRDVQSLVDGRGVFISFGFYSIFLQFFFQCYGFFI